MDKHGAPPPYSSLDPLTPSTTPIQDSATPRLANPLLPFNSSPPVHNQQECRRRSGRRCCARRHDHNPYLPVLRHMGHPHTRNHDEGRGRCGRRGRHRFGRYRSPSTSSFSSSSSATSANDSVNGEERHAAEMNDISTTLHKTHIKELTHRPLHSLASLILEEIRSHRNLDHRALHEESRAVGEGLRAKKRQAKKMLREQKRLLKEELRAFHREAKARHKAGHARGEWDNGGCGRRRRDRNRHGKLDLIPKTMALHDIISTDFTAKEALPR